MPGPFFAADVRNESVEIMNIKTLLAATLLAWGTSATADFTFDLDAGNTAIAGYTGPYANVNVHWVDSDTAIITFTSLCTGGGDPPCTVGDQIFLMGDGGSVAVNVNATSWTLSAISGSNSGVGFTPGPYSDGGSGNVDGWGVFNQTITTFDGYTHSSDTISFQLDNTGGTWADESEVLAANLGDSLAAAHIFVATYGATGADASVKALATGFAAGSGNPEFPPQQIPEPGVLGVLSLGLLGLSLTAMRRRQR